MKQCKFKFALGVLVLSLVATVNSFAVPIEPFYFENAVDQEATWNDLMKYKLWGTGIPGDPYGVAFIGQEVFITDSNGYSGSATAGFQMQNIKHSIGGPLAFAGNFSNGDGQDTILSGPSHFGGNFTVGGNAVSSNNVVLRGNYCVNGNSSSMANGLAKGNGTLTCDADDIPVINTDLDIPTVDYSLITFDREVDSYTFSAKTDYIDIPVGSDFYDIHVKGNLRMESSNDTLYIRMPEGRYVRIFVDGNISISSDLHNILILTVKE